MRACGTRGHDRMVRALKAMLDRNVSGSEIDQTSRNEKGRYLAWPARAQQQRRIGNARKASNAGPDHRAGSATFVVGGWMPIGIIKGLLRGAHCEDDEIVDLALV